MLSRILQNIDTLSALLSPAAEAGLPAGQNNLGRMYQCGWGVEVNLVKAVELYQKVCRHKFFKISTHSARVSFASRRIRGLGGSE
jgi:TPR repeat protein